jgi:hypothetical protein
VAADFGPQPLHRQQLKMVAGVDLMGDHHRDGMPAVAPELPHHRCRRKLRIGLGDIEPATPLAQVDGRRLVGGEGNQPGEVCWSDDVDAAFGNGDQTALAQEFAGAVDLRSVRLKQRPGGWRVAPKLLHHVSPGPVIQLPRQICQLPGNLLLESGSVAPQLGRSGHERVLVLEPPIELLLSHRERLRIRGRLDPVPQRGPEFHQRLEGSFSRALELLTGIGIGLAERANQLGNELSATGQHRECRIHEHGRRLLDGGACALEKGRRVAQSRQNRRGPSGGFWLTPGQQRVERLKQVGQPEPGVPEMRPLLSEPIGGAPDFSQQRRPVDLGLQILGIELLKRAGDRPQRGQVLANGFGIEPPQPGVCRHQPRGARGGRIEVVLEVQVGPAEVIDR